MINLYKDDADSILEGLNESPFWQILLIIWLLFGMLMWMSGVIAWAAVFGGDKSDYYREMFFNWYFLFMNNIFLIVFLNLVIVITLLFSHVNHITKRDNKLR